jgi:hypothetical protein
MSGKGDTVLVMGDDLGDIESLTNRLLAERSSMMLKRVFYSPKAAFFRIFKSWPGMSINIPGPDQFHPPVRQT